MLEAARKFTNDFLSEKQNNDFLVNALIDILVAIEHFYLHI